jgi:sugar phosphate isomerase/epimerase
MYAELPLPEALRTLHANDWRCFEMSSEHLVWLDRCEDSQARIAESLRTIDTLQITMPQAHAKLVADVAQPDLEKRRIDIEEVERHITICAQLGVKCVVVHPGFAEGFTNEQEKRQLLAINKDSFTRLADHAGSLGLKIGIENGLGMTMRNGAARLAADAEGLIELVKTIDHPAIGVTIDTSHGNVNTGDVPGTVRQLGSLICCTHISDNDRSGDQHRIDPLGGHCTSCAARIRRSSATRSRLATQRWCTGARCRIACSSEWEPSCSTALTWG